MKYQIKICILVSKDIEQKQENNLVNEYFPYKEKHHPADKIKRRFSF
jgi:hypothetical protein